MSTSLAVAGKHITVYCGIPALIGGVLGGLVNTVVFSSLRTFRQSSCAFHLTIMSTVSIGQLFFGLSSRILIALFGVDGTESSLFYCKFRLYATQVCIGTSMSCFSLATIDQYLATCSRPRWQQLCNIKLAQRIVMANAIIWMLHGIPYLVYFDQIQLSTIDKVTCTSSNLFFNAYRGYFIVLVLNGYLPITIATFFGLLAYRNVQQIAYRTVPLVRRELDKQITKMVLLQALVSMVTLLPYTTANAVLTNTNLTSDPVIEATLQLAVPITNAVYYLYFGSPFYIYICASERFRRQFIYVLSKIHLCRWNEPRMDINQVSPET